MVIFSIRWQLFKDALINNLIRNLSTNTNLAELLLARLADIIVIIEINKKDKLQKFAY